MGENKEYIKRGLVITSILIISILTFWLISNSKFTQWINDKITEYVKADTKSEATTYTYYQVNSVNGNKLTVSIYIENQKGIESIQTEEMTIYPQGNTYILLDRELTEGQAYQLKVKMVGEDEEELHTLVASEKPTITTSNYTAETENATIDIEIEYPDNPNLINYYSLDKGQTWNEYSEKIKIDTTLLPNLDIKSDYNEGKTIYKQQKRYLDMLTQGNVDVFKKIKEKNISLSEFGFSATKENCQYFKMESENLMAANYKDSYMATFKLKMKENIVAEEVMISFSAYCPESIEQTKIQINIYFKDGTNEQFEKYFGFNKFENDEWHFEQWDKGTVGINIECKLIDYIEINMEGLKSEIQADNITFRNCIGF